MEIYNSFSDSKGYMWFGSDKGAIRYNGIKFETFNVRDGLPSNDVFSFCEDRFGRIWIETYVNKLCYFKDGVFHTEENTPWLKLDFKHTRPIEVTNTPNKDVIIAFLGTYTKYVEIVDTTKIIIDVPEEIKNYVDTISIWDYQIRSYTKIYLQKESDGTNKLILPNVNIGFKNKTIIYSTSKKLIKSLYGGCDIFEINHTGDLFKASNNNFIGKLHLLPSLLESFHNCFNTNNKFYLTTQFGSYVYNTKNGLADYIITNPYISFFNKDFEGNVWISTKGNGIYKLPLTTSSANLISTEKMINTIIVKQNNSLVFIDQNMKTFSIDSLNKLHKQSFLDKFKFSNCLIRTYNDTFFLKQNNLSHRYNSADKNKIIPIAKDINFNKMYKTNNGVFYVDKYQYIFISNRNDTLLKKYKNNAITFFYDFTYNNIIMASLSGIFKVNDTSEIQILSSNNYTPLFIKQFKQNMTIIDNLGQLHVLSNFNSSKPKDSILPISAFFDKYLFLNDSITFVNSNQGIYLINPFDYSFKKLPDYYSTKNVFSIFLDNKKLYFAREDDIVVANIDSIFYNTLPAKLNIENIKIGSQLFYSNSITTPYNTSNDIIIQFNAVNYSSTINGYQYKLIFDKNTDTTWKALSVNQLSILKPQYGTYQIFVRALDNNNQYSEIAKCSIDVQKPYWATTWFKILCLILLIALLYFIYTYFLRQQLKRKTTENEIEKRIMKSEFKALNALINPHFVFNSLNNIQSLVNQNKPDNANLYLSIFSKLMRQNMNNIDDGIISLHKELELITNYVNMEKLRHGDVFSFDITIAEHVDEDKIMIPPLLLQPIVENAILHGIMPSSQQQKYLHIQVKEDVDGQRILITIEDNGVGIQPHQNKNHQSVALSNIEKRIQYLNTIYAIHISISTEPVFPTLLEKGTRVKIEIK